MSVTDNPNDENFKYYAFTRGEDSRDAFYLGAYLGYEDDKDAIRSLSGKDPKNNLNITDCRNYCQKNGKGYDEMGFYQLTFLQAMYILKYGNLDSQSAIGKGWTSQSSKTSTGATNGKGADYGESNGKEQMRFSYLEDFYGNLLYGIDGVATDSSCEIYTATDNFNNNRDGYKDTGIKGANNGGYVTKVFGSDELGFLGEKFGGSSSTYYCDYGNVRSGYFLFFGGDWSNDSNAGAFRASLFYGASERSGYLGSRLMFL